MCLLLSQLFSGVHVWVLGLVECSLQVLQLFARKRGSAPTLFAFQVESRFRFRVRIVGAARTFGRKNRTWNKLKRNKNA
jgi:hypothetical protein